MHLSFRQNFADYFGPAFHGMTLERWLAILNDTNLRIEFPYFYRILPTTFKCLINTRLKIIEEKKYKSEWEKAEILQPIFILGHWRSGTTFLQNIFARDDRFAYPNLYQVMNPLTFLLTEHSLVTKIFSLLIPKQRLFDNIPFNLKVPHEDEFIAWHASGLTSYMGWNFPRASERFDAYLDFGTASGPDRIIWKEELIRFLQKISYKCHKPIVLKSPQHTCRIGLLLEMFPGAKFIHIHRNPYRVFQSTVKLNEFVLKISRFQRPPLNWVKERVLRQYQEMYDLFFREKDLIPKGYFAEVRFEDLENQPLTTMEKIYDELALPEFGQVKETMRAYFESLNGYQKNIYRPLPNELVTAVNDAWSMWFREWGYQKK